MSTNSNGLKSIIKEIETLHKEYNAMYDEASSLTKGLDACGFDSCSGSCYREVNKKNPSPQCCCGGSSVDEICKHYDEGLGCTVRALTCKLWYCGSQRIPSETLAKLNELSKRNKFYTFRGDFYDYLAKKYSTVILRCYREHLEKGIRL